MTNNLGAVAELLFAAGMGVVLGSLFLRAHNRAERVGDAMVARCFDGQPGLLFHYHWHADELVVGVVFAAMIVGLRVGMGR